MTQGHQGDVASKVAGDLPYLRRYARALTGSQKTGDAFAIATLETLLIDATPVIEMGREGLFHTFHGIWTSTGSPLGQPDSATSAQAQAHMAKLTPHSREALLLHVLEGFTPSSIETILSLDPGEAAGLIVRAQAEMASSVTGKVMVIEDEAIIAMDITEIVSSIGHRVTGVARTARQAIDLAKRVPPDLILADIQLADNSSGIDAVNEILRDFPEMPVIFITAFPERLLTGEKPEPAFLIPKPFSEEQLRSAVSQAMFFASTEVLHA